MKDGLSFGVSFGYYVNDNIEVGFLVSRQDSALATEGTNARDLVDMPVYNYHGIFTYNFGDGDAMVRPFLMGGLGATSYAPGEPRVSTSTTKPSSPPRGAQDSNFTPILLLAFR